jgi:hypothetical protein
MSAAARLAVLTALLSLVAPTLAPAAPPAFAEAFTWSGFYDYWSANLRGQHGAVQIVTLVAILSLALLLLSSKKRK